MPMPAIRAQIKAPSVCGVCGHACDDVGEFHPHLFCVLKKAGRTDPWRDFKDAVALLGVEGLPPKPPLVRDLPLNPRPHGRA
jgi:hypothetical protein